jgi:hypothetical protein
MTDKVHRNTITSESHLPSQSRIESHRSLCLHTLFFTFLHSIGTCRMRRSLAVLRSFFRSSLLCTFSCHPSPPTVLPSCLTSSCHLFLGLPLNLVVPTFIYIILFWEFYFLPFSVHAQTNIILTVFVSSFIDSSFSAI